MSWKRETVVGPVEGVRLWRVAFRNDLGRLSVYDRLCSMTLFPWLFSKWPPLKPAIARCITQPQLRMLIESGLIGSRTSHTLPVADVPHAVTTAPHFNCKCGLYAYRMCSDVISDLQHYIMRELACVPFVVLGTVAMWGKIVEHEYGYRAQFAYPSRLAVIFHPVGRGNPHKLARKIASAYRVSCRAVSSTEILPHTEWQEWHRIILGG